MHRAGQGLTERCVRVLVEPLDPDPETAVAHGAAMEDVLLAAAMIAEVERGGGVRD